MVPRAVLMKSGLVSINTARQNISKTAVLVNTARQVNAAHSKTTVNAARPMSYLSKTTHSTGNPQIDLQDKGVINSGCSRYVTGNMSYLTDYKEIDGGYSVWNEIGVNAGDSKLMLLGINLILLAKVNVVTHKLTTAGLENEGFEQIVDFLNANPIRYALTINPTIYTSCIEQFWATVKAKTVNGEVQLQALVDGKKIIITESIVRRDLQLEDAEGVDCLPNATIFEQLTLIGYEKISQKLTFYKAFFSPQWKFLIHTILQCLSSKTTAWNEFSSTMASAIICLATNQKFNFSKYIFESMVKNLENVSGKFLMYPRYSSQEGDLLQLQEEKGHVGLGSCKEPRESGLSELSKITFTDGSKEKGDVLDTEAEDSSLMPNAAVAFMGQIVIHSATTNNPVNEVHSNDNQIFDNVDYQIQEMHQEEHLDSDAETEIDDNTIPYHQYLLDTEAQNVPTEVSADNTDKRKEKSIAFLQSEKEKILSEKKDLADSYLDEIVCLKTANKVARDMLQRFNMPTQTIPMLSKKPKRATKDLHKDILGTRQLPGLGSTNCSMVSRLEALDILTPVISARLINIVEKFLLVLDSSTTILRRTVCDGGFRSCVPTAFMYNRNYDYGGLCSKVMHGKHLITKDGKHKYWKFSNTLHMVPLRPMRNRKYPTERKYVLGDVECITPDLVEIMEREFVNKTTRRMVCEVLVFIMKQKRTSVSTTERRCRKTEPKFNGRCSYSCSSLRKLHGSMAEDKKPNLHTSSGLDLYAILQMTTMMLGKTKGKEEYKYGTRTYCFTVRTQPFCTSKRPRKKPPSVPLYKETGSRFVSNGLMMMRFVPILRAVPITPVNVPAAPAPENAIGSPSTIVISEGAPAVTESLLPHQIPLPDISDLMMKTLFRLMLTVMCFDTHNAPETASEASSSNTLSISMEEIHEFEHLDVWILVPCPDNILIIPLKWIFKIKLDEYGDVLKNKARTPVFELKLLQDADMQDVMTHGRKYLLNASPYPDAVLKSSGCDLNYETMDLRSTKFRCIVTIKVLLLYAVIVFNTRDPSTLISVTTSSKSSIKIEEEVYACQPPGFEDPDFPDRVYKKELCIVQFEKLMHEKFQMSSIGELAFFLGLQVKQKKDGIFISQDKYVEEILKKFGFTEVKTASTPMETQKPLLKDEDGEEVDVHMYRSNDWIDDAKVFGMEILEFNNGWPQQLMLLGITYTDGSYVNAARHTLTMLSYYARVISSVLREDAEGVDCLLNSTIFEQLALMGPKTTAWNEFSSTMISAIICLATNQKFNFSKYIFESMVRNLDNLFGKFLMYPRCQETMGDTTAPTRFESVSTHSNDSLLARGNTLRSDEDRLKLDDLMAICTNLQNKVLDLEKTKTTQHNEIAMLVTTATIKTVDDITLAQALEEMKSTKPKKKRVVTQELGESTTTISSQLSSQQSQDKGKGILIEPVMPMKKKNQISLDEETALNLQAEFDEEERLAREKAEKEEEANIALIETWDDIQAKIDVDHQLAERLQAQEQEELSIEEKATLFQQLLEKRRKHFAAKRAEEKRNKPPTKAQQRKIMCTYLKNMEGYKLKDLKLKEFDSIQEMFDRAFKRVNTFEDFRTELVEGKEKRAGTELIQENTKKQKVEDDKEIAELKQCLEIILDEEEVTIDAIPLAVKSPSIVGWKIYKEGRKSYYQIMRADEKSQMYMIFSHMLKSFNREDLEDLYKLVKAKYKSTRPVEDLDLLLWGDLKTMFEPHVEDKVWRNQQEYKVLD
ncbi:putative ribonuclease H-like domain-containing protein [Tanacetum coccineum]